MAADKTKLIFNPLSGNFDTVQNVDTLVEGPASSVDNTVPRYDSTTGKLLKTSGVVINDADAVSGITALDVDNINLNGNTISTTDVDGNLILAPNGAGIIQPSCNIAPATDNTLKLGTTAKRFAELNVAYGSFPYFDITSNDAVDYHGSVGIGSSVPTYDVSLEAYQNIGVGPRANGVALFSIKPMLLQTGDVASGTSEINIATGDASAGNSADINLETGTASGTRGDINLSAENINLAGDLVFTGTTATFSGTVLQGVDDPVNPTEAANKQYVDGEVSGLLADIPAASMTFTNKTFDADAAGNSITNIEDANIKAAAAIDTTKLADGSVTNTEFQYINTLSSNAQTQLDSKLGLSISAQSVNFNAAAGFTYIVDTSGGAVAATLPAATLNTFVIIKDAGAASTNAITLTGTVDGEVNPTITSDYGCAFLVANGSAWFKI